VSLFGKTLFGGSKFVRRALIPPLILSVVLWALFVHVPNPDLKERLLLHAMCALPILLAIGLLDPQRFRWAFRIVTAVVFAVYVWCTVDELFFIGNIHELPQWRGGPSPWEALLGFVTIGLPCLVYTIFGQVHSTEKTPSTQRLSVLTAFPSDGRVTRFYAPNLSSRLALACMWRMRYLASNTPREPVLAARSVKRS